jgi:hypothetical protein
MSILNGVLWVDGEQVEHIGSESICSHCKKLYNCRAFEDDYKLTVDFYGAPAQICFKELFRVSQILGCPTREFEYKKV